MALVSASAPWSAAQSDDEFARRHFESGAAYLQRSDYEAALREFKAAYELSKRAPLLLDLATVYERMGKLDPAIDALRGFLALVPAAPDRATLEARIANLERRRVAATVAPAPSASAAISAPSATAAASPVPAPAPAPARPTHPARGPAYLALGAGGALALGAVVTGLVAKSRYDQADSTCAPRCSDADVAGPRSWAIASDVLTGLAVVGVGVGAVLWFGAGAPAQASALPQVRATALPRAAQVEATWRF